MTRIVEHRFVNKTADCWLWTGSKNVQGYGCLSFRVDKKTVTWRVHRKAYEQEIGPIPEGLFVCHKCDVRNCVRPDHLWVGTQSENMIDCYQKKRHPQATKLVEHCRQGHKFNKQNIGYRTANAVSGKRFCRACKRISAAKRKDKSKIYLRAWRKRKREQQHLE